MSKVTVVGAGLAGCEAAWQLAQRGFSVDLLEMKPEKMSPAPTATSGIRCCPPWVSRKRMTGGSIGTL